MRIIYFAYLVTLFTWKSIAQELDDSHGLQSVEHDDEVDAVVFRPDGAGGSSLARKHFEGLWNVENDDDVEVETEDDGEKLPPKRIVEIRHVEEKEEEEVKEFPSRPIDPNNPEELVKHKQLRGQETYSKILSENKGISVTGMFEGDMRFPPYRNAAGDTWPKSRFGSLAGLVPIPYKINKFYNDTERAIIKSAMALYQKHTCIRFVPRRSEISYIYITDAKGCWAYVGKTGYSAQTVSLGRPGCLSKGIAAHELMHVVGFQHEHSRSDRDKYVTILEHNIQSKMRQNFEVHKNTRNLVIYDYNSVMHYSKNAFSKFQYLPAIEITPKRKPEPNIGQRERMSPYDIEEVKYLYNCAQGTYKRCGRDFLNSRGNTFTSPNYPKPYPAESHCTWKITVQRGRFVSLTISNLDIQDSKLCQQDAILVHDGQDASAPRLKAICGTDKKSTTVVSTGNTMFVMFTTDPNNKGSHKGFRASFKISFSKGSVPALPTVPTLPPIRTGRTEFSCNFDANTCGMTQDTLDEIDWIRYRGKTPSQDTGPSKDHTSGKGYYMYVESSLPSKLGDNAIIRTPWLKKGKLSVQFAYHMLGTYMGTLRLYAFEKRKGNAYGHQILLWERHGNYGNKWHVQTYSYVPKPDVEFVQFYWEAFVFFYQSDFGLDDIRVFDTSKCSAINKGRAGACGPAAQPVKTSTASPTTSHRTTPPSPVTTQKVTTTTIPISTDPVPETSCDFESGFCLWEQDVKDDFDWIRTNQPTPSQNTGPAGDHTTSSGYYLFIEASSPRIFGDSAKLVSPKLTKGSHCLKMWYNMNGAQMGSLLVKQVVGKTVTTLVEKSGNKGKDWLYLEQDIITPKIKTSARNANFRNEDYIQIVIEAVRGTGYPGDLAIDDIAVTDSLCTSKVIVTTPSTYARSAHCDFDQTNNLCGFKNSGFDDFDWTQNKGKTQSGSTGPTNDHTLGDESGSYMYIEASSPRKSGHEASLISPKLGTGKYCVKFFVHMWGSGMGSVKVLAREYADDNSLTEKVLWQLEGTQGDFWLPGEIEFESALSMRFVEIIFKGIVGGTFTSDAALDDVTIDPGSCNDNVIVTTTASKTPAVTTRRPRPPTTTRKPKPPTTTRKPKPPTTTRKPKPPTTTRKPKPPTTTRKPIRTRPTKKPAPVTTTRARRTRRPTTKPTTTRQPTTTTTTTTKRPTTTTTATTTTTTTRKPTTTTSTTTTTRPTTTTTTTTKKTTTTLRPRPGPRKVPAGRTINTTPPVKIVPSPTKTVAAIPLDNKQQVFQCDFESKVFCGMMQLNGDIFDWQRQVGNTGSSGTGPQRDHTRPKQTGRYIYAEASKPRMQNHNAIIATPPLSARPQKRCVTFWYHMHGKHMGTLRVFSEIASNGIIKKSLPRSQRVLVYSQSGPKGNAWKKAQFDIDKSSTLPTATLRLHFEAVIGSGYASDIAIDDICITADPCNVWSSCDAKPTTTSPPQTGRLLPTKAAIIKKVPQTTSTTTTTQTTTTKATTTTQPLQQENFPVLQGMSAILKLCTFDAKVKKQAGRPAQLKSDDLCGWQQVTGTDDFDWTWKSGATPSSFTGPNSDHTSGNGHYLYIESSAPRVPKDNARLISRKMYATTYCIDFYYHMHGASIGQLFIRAQQETTDKPLLVSNVKILKGAQGNGWKNNKVTYRPKPNVKSVVFRFDGEVGKDYQGDIAIDDVSVTPGRCSACFRPNRKAKDSTGKERTYYTGCIHSKLFYVRCCDTSITTVKFVRVPNCNLHSVKLDALSRMCYGV